MEFSFEVMTELLMDHQKGSTGSVVKASWQSLKLSPNLDKSQYLNGDNTPNAEGCKAITTTLVQGLINNLHYAHEQGYRDSAEHLRSIITHLEKGFASVVTVMKEPDIGA